MLSMFFTTLLKSHGILQAKLIGSCQSSIELVRHLHNLLMEDSKLSLGAAKSSEVTTLITRYDTLITLARAREQQIRELR